MAEILTQDAVDLKLRAVDEKVRDLPREILQRTKGAKTGKGYDTTGYPVDWMWEVLIGEFGPSRIHVSVSDVEAEKGTWGEENRTKWTVSLRSIIRIVDGGELLAETTAFGGHDASLRGDALKGAESNAQKKALSKWGIGIDAYKGILDDDNRPLPEAEAKPRKKKDDDADKPMSESAQRKLQTIYTQVFEDELSIPPELTTGEGRKAYQVCLDCEHCTITKDEAIKAIADIFKAAFERAA